MARRKNIQENPELTLTEGAMQETKEDKVEMQELSNAEEQGENPTLSDEQAISEEHSEAQDINKDGDIDIPASELEEGHTIIPEYPIETVVPPFALELLKKFKKFPQLQVSKFGGVYSPDTQLDESFNAILYKNPFYNE